MDASQRTGDTRSVPSNASWRGPAVVALRDKLGGMEFEVGKRRLILGSSAACEIPLPDPYVSSRHCVLEGGPRGLIVRDLGSKNGTAINATPIQIGLLHPGSILAVGRTSLVALAEVGRGRRSAHEELCGADPVFRAAVDQAVRAAATNHPILIVGETGTGKDLVARLIHEASSRAGGPLVSVNCGAIPSQLIGSELFGHERGAFTGATHERDGYFVQADGGTLFLDELGELPLEQQPHLLRVLETRRVRRLGGASERDIDVRVIAATNRLEGLGSDRASLRLDLFHRLSTVIVALPPLRKRRADLPALVASILGELSIEHGARHISADGWAALESHDWPGNIRELRQALSRAVVLGGAELTPADLFGNVAALAPVGARFGTLAVTKDGEPVSDLPPYEAMLARAMREALCLYPTIRAAASYLGMPKSTFADKAERFGLLVGRKRRR